MDLIIEGKIPTANYEDSNIFISNSQVLEILKLAKEKYIQSHSSSYNLNDYHKAFLGMCYFIDSAFCTKFKVTILYSDIEKVIPEFNPDFFETVPNKQNYWWNIFDQESRIKAFDILINIYEEKQWISYRY